MKNHLILGNWNSLCDSCGRKFKANTLRKRWDGLMVCEEDWEQRHPQDLLRVQREQISVPWSRPYPAQDTFIPETLWTKAADAIGFNEFVTKQYNKNVGNYLAPSSTLNTHTLNYDAFNANGPLETSTEVLTISETFLVTLARFFSETMPMTEVLSNQPNRPLSDSMSMGESTWFTETEHNADSLSFTEIKAFAVSKSLSDSMSMTESLSTTFSSTTALNGAALDSLALG